MSKARAATLGVLALLALIVAWPDTDTSTYAPVSVHAAPVEAPSSTPTLETTTAQGVPPPDGRYFYREGEACPAGSAHYAGDPLTCWKCPTGTTLTRPTGTTLAPTCVPAVRP